MEACPDRSLSGRWVRYRLDFRVMALQERTLELTAAQLRAARRVNTLLSVAPRLKPDGWRLRLSQRLNRPVDRIVGQIGAALLKRKGVAVASQGPADSPVPIRIMSPVGQAKALVMDLHGGGWVIGSAALNDHLTSHLARDGFAVGSVDYRLLDDKVGIWMQDAVEDCVAALRWAQDAGRKLYGVRSVLVIGESAGAHLAALALLALRDRSGLDGIAGVVFVQGVFDLSGSARVRAAGPETLLFDGPNLERDLSRLTPGLSEAERRDPRLSPLYASLEGLPPALFISGTIDPFSEDSQRLAEAWARTGDATILHVPEAPHAFQHLGNASASLAQAEIRSWMTERVVQR